MHPFRRLVLAGALLAPVLLSGCDSEVKIGAIISETGATSSYGQQVRKGMELAEQQINARGEGPTLTILYRDDQTSPEAGVQIAQQLIEQDKVSAIIGAISSPVTMRVAEVTQANDIVLLSPSASAPEISGAGERVFRNYPSDVLEGTSMAEFARDLGLESIAILALDNSYGAGLSGVFKEKYESNYRKIVGEFTFQGGDEAAIRAHVQEIAKLAPDGVYIVAYLDDVATALKALDEAGIDTVRLGSGAITDRIANLAGDAADRLIFPQPNSWDAESNDPTIVNFVSAYREKYGEDPDIYAAHGFDAVKILYEAVVRGGGSHRDSVYMGMKGTSEFKGAAGLTVFDANGDVVRYPRLFVIDDGKARPYSEFAEEGGSARERG